MSFEDQIDTVLERYQKGWFTLLEIFPLLVDKTPEENLGDLKIMLPEDVWISFVKWVNEYRWKEEFELGVAQIFLSKKSSG